MYKFNKVCVLMSTYNGSDYIEIQIRSIMEQKGIETFLLIRDDGSSDNTMDIIHKLSDEYKNRIEVEKGDNVGFIKSFSALVNLAQKKYHQYDLFAFVDQDDEWLSDNLERRCSRFQNMNMNIPCMVSSNSCYVDANNEDLGLFHTNNPYYTRYNVLIETTEQGCSMLFNRCALEIYSDNNPSHCWHDRWMFYICYYMGAFEYIHAPLFKYRIHGKNALGEIKSPKNLLYRIADNLKSLNSNTKEHVHIQFVREFLDTFRNNLTHKDIVNMEHYINYRNNFTDRLFLLFSKEFVSSKNTFRYNEMFKRHILLGLV